MGKLSWLLVAVPLSIAAKLAHLPTAAFVLSIVGIVPLAGVIGRGTEDLAIHSGSRIGGLINATFANLAELIIGIFLIVGGQIEVVKVSIIGSIIGNILLVLGAAFLLGGLKFREQSFNPRLAGMHSASLALAVVGIMMPAIFHRVSPSAGLVVDESVSAAVAAILILLYVASLVFSFVTHQEFFATHEVTGPAGWSKRKALFMLLGAAVVVAIESEVLVSSLESATAALHLSKLFVGLILVPIVGNAAENSSAIVLALKNKVDVSLEIAIGSSTQIALFVAPLLVFVSLIVGHPMNFFFTGFEIAAVGISTAIVSLICLDGRSNWLEGAQLIAAYLIMGISSFFL
ncbi:MAG: calcium/proton exchanger [Actinomycetota bacterium]|nr:calcium/proton exchanger [Actinomycetota bacterium]